MKNSNGKALYNCFGVLYVLNDNPIYTGLLINGIAEEGKELIISDEKIIYHINKILLFLNLMKAKIYIKIAFVMRKI